MKRAMLLVVDQDLVSRVHPAHILRSFQEHVQVLECETLADALRAVEVHHITHVLLDVTLVAKNEFELVDVFREKSKLKSIKLIAYFSDDSFVNSDAFKAKGFDACLSKPLSSDELFACLNFVKS